MEMAPVLAHKLFRFTGLRRDFRHLGSNNNSSMTPISLNPGRASFQRLSLSKACGFWAFLALALQTLAQPVITRISPVSGPPGTQIAIYGSGFSSLEGVYFNFSNPISATVLEYNDSEILAVVPPGVTFGPVIVYSGFFYATSSQYFHVPPILTSIYTASVFGVPVEPPIGSFGGTLSISGVNFSDTGYAPAVYLGTNLLSSYVTQDNLIYAKLPSAPPAASTAFVTISNAWGAATSTNYLYFNPVITGYPSTATPGSTVNLGGVSFLGVTSVSAGSFAVPFAILSGTNLSFTLPTNAIDANVVVTSPGGSYITPAPIEVLPEISSFSPLGGPPKTAVMIYGGGFLNATSVSFGNIPAASFSVVSATTISAVVPDNVPTAPITVATPNGSGSSAAKFSAPPILQSQNPSSGLPGALVTLSGSGLTGVTAVSLGSLTAPFNAVGDSSITAEVPLSARAGQVLQWSVTTPGGTATLTQSFTVTGPLPGITGFQPAYGPVGTTVTLFGTNLSTATSVTFGGVAAQFVANGGGITAVVPAGASSGFIVVTTPNGTAQSASAFNVGSSADLSLSLAALLNPAYAYSPLSVNVMLQNAGPLPASAATVTVTLPTNAVFSTVKGLANYNQLGNAVILNFGTVAPNGSATATVVVKVGAPGPLTFSGLAQSPTPDSHTSNNSANASVAATLPEIDLQPVSGPQFLLFWPSAASSFILQSSPKLLAAPWSAVTNGYSDDGVTRQLLLNAGLSNAFFRLNNSSP